MPLDNDTSLVADASIHLIADDILDGLVAGALPPCMLHVNDVDSVGFELGIKPLDDRHPTDFLLGFTAPHDWHALGMATAGWAYRSDQRCHPDRERSRVHVATLVSRTREVAHRVHVEGDDQLSRRLSDEAPTGEQIDLLRLALSLDTDPPPCESAAYWTIQWLTAVGSTEAAALRHWDDVARLHPARQLLDRDPCEAGGEFVDVVRAFQRAASWATMRRLASEGLLPIPDLLPDDASWLDDGAFARFLLARSTSLPEVRNRLSERLPASLLGQVDATLDELSIPATVWPDRGTA